MPQNKFKGFFSTYSLTIKFFLLSFFITLLVTVIEVFILIFVTRNFVDDPFGYIFPYAIGMLLLNLLITIIFTIVVLRTINDPLAKIYGYIERYLNGERSDINIKSKNIIFKLFLSISALTDSVKSEFKKVEKENQIQEDFILLSGHLLRTPLTSIIGYFDLLKALNKDKNLEETMNNISIALTKLQTLEENILSISAEENKLINAPLEEVLIKDVIEETYNEMVLIANKKNIKMSASAEGLKDVKLKANKANIKQAYKNLVDNAVKFTSEGGVVKLFGNIKDNNIILSVSDTGVGLSQEEVGNIYKKFSRVSSALEYNTDGLGIGLYIVKLITDMYKGRTWVDSIKGNGSVFNIEFPLS